MVAPCERMPTSTATFHARYFVCCFVPSHVRFFVPFLKPRKVKVCSTRAALDAALTDIFTYRRDHGYYGYYASGGGGIGRLCRHIFY